MRSASSWWALFVEMYRFPLTIFVLSGWFQIHCPDLDWFSHDAGHILGTLFGWMTNPHCGPFHVLSHVLLVAGFRVVPAAWKPLRSAQLEQRRAIEGAYAYVRHPQHVGIILVLLGFPVQWPTLLTRAMFPFLVVTYVRLASGEAREALASFGKLYAADERKVPGFIPGWSVLVGRMPAKAPARP